MKQYEKVLGGLGMPEELIALATGRLQLPNGINEQPARCYGFPPALIPFWSAPDAMIYTGYWSHWFADRDASFVKMYVKLGYVVSEIARTCEQFKAYEVLNELVFADESTPEVADFAAKLGVDLGQIEQFAETHGDDPTQLYLLPEFAVRTPLESCSGSKGYDGGFPTVSNANGSANKQASSFELNETTARAFLASPDCPPWLKTTDKQHLFQTYLSAGDLTSAWFTLNSSGWNFAAARAALTKLAHHSEVDNFHAMVEAWLSLPHEQYGVGY
ncbi:hypothetical protein [Pseudoduganella sp. R-43]